MEKVSPEELTDRLLDRAVKTDSQAWIHGQSASWQPITASPLRDAFFQSLGQVTSRQSLPLLPDIAQKEKLETFQNMAQQAQEAWQDLSRAIDKNTDVGVLGEMFSTAVEKTVSSCQEGGVGISEQTAKTLAHFGDTIQSLAVMDGDMITLAKIDAVKGYAERELYPQNRSAMAESTLGFSF